MIKILLITVSVVGGMFLVIISGFFGWISYVRPNYAVLNDLFPNKFLKPLTIGRYFFWISTIPLIIIAMILLGF
jgi:hypothetical protein